MDLTLFHPLSLKCNKCRVPEPQQIACNGTVLHCIQYLPITNIVLGPRSKYEKAKQEENGTYARPQTRPDQQNRAR